MLEFQQLFTFFKTCCSIVRNCVGIHLLGTNTLAYVTATMATNKKFNNMDTCGKCYKTFYGCKLQLFIIS
jgi:hypothetical protein